MPKKLERQLMASARKAGLHKGSKRYGAYVFGTLARIEKRKKKGRRR